MESTFEKGTLTKLNKPLDERFVSKRKGASNRELSYIEGHDAIDQANRIFGYGNWGHEVVECTMVVLPDPITGEAVGIEYSARVRLSVKGAMPIIEVGSQPVSTWNVQDQVFGRRASQARYDKTKPDYTIEITHEERKQACAVIAEAHEQAKKGAATDAMKRAMRAYGDQFGNGLYGDGRILIYDEEDHEDTAPVSARQLDVIKDLATRLRRRVQPPTNFGEAKKLIEELQAS